jgi:flagellar basal body-associated protein FliL
MPEAREAKTAVEAKTAEPAQAAAEAKAPPPAAERAPAMFSPAGLVVLFVVMIIEAAVVYGIALVIQRSGGLGGDIAEAEPSVELVDIERAVGASGREKLSLKVTLYLNREVGSVEELKALVNSRLPRLEEQATNFFWERNEAELRDYDAIQALSEVLKEVLNANFVRQGTGEVVPVIKRVGFTIRSIPR